MVHMICRYAYINTAPDEVFKSLHHYYIINKSFRSHVIIPPVHVVCIVYILEDFENTSPYFCTFLANRICIEKLLAGFNVQPRNGMNQSLI